MSDAVNHPKHYNSHPGGVECIELVELLPFCHGNAIKYLWRADHKGARAEDLCKALWYVARAPRWFFVACEQRAQVSDVLARALSGFSGVRRAAIEAIARNELSAAHAAITFLIEQGE